MSRISSQLLSSLVIVLIFGITRCLDNGLGKTPPMGWLSWERFRCNIDCLNDPENCISEKLFMTMADHVAEDGFKDAGYEYIIVDDCWLASERTANRQLQPDPKRFPHGIKSLADYVHGKGLKFGLYENWGPLTCARWPGSEWYIQMDMQQFADWGVDYIKLDACNYPPEQYDRFGYPPVEFFANITGRPMYMTCSYPLYQIHPGGLKVNYTQVAQQCNAAYNTKNIDDSWDSLYGIIQEFAANKDNFTQVAGPGFFNHPDELILGNFGLSYEQERVQMGMWSIFAAPLIMSTDLRNLRPSSKELLINKRLIEINQDPLGKQGILIKQVNHVSFWCRQLSKQAFAFALLNGGVSGTPVNVTFSLDELGINQSPGYNLTDAFNGINYGSYKPNVMIWAEVNPTGIFMAKAVPLTMK